MIKYKKLIIALAVVVSGVAMAISTLAMADEVLGLGAEGKEIEVTIRRGDSAGVVTDKLADSGVIKFKSLFSLFLKITKSSDKLKSGVYTLRDNMDYLQLASTLKKGGENADEVSVTIAEGLTQRQVFRLLEESRVCSQNELYDYAEKCDLPFESGSEKYRLEGYLYPDTYRFYQNDNPQSVIDKILANFRSKFTDAIAQRAEQIGLTPYEALTLASIVEKEATSEDRALVASVFINRLNDWDKPLLQSCATVLYALETVKEVLSYEDIKTKSPYNTYLNAGLPVGPICNPGIDSIESVLNHAQTDYYYFVADGTGGHIFSKNYKDHVDAVMASASK